MKDTASKINDIFVKSGNNLQNIKNEKQLEKEIASVQKELAELYKKNPNKISDTRRNLEFFSKHDLLKEKSIASFSKSFTTWLYKSKKTLFPLNPTADIVRAKKPIRAWGKGVDIVRKSVCKNKEEVDEFLELLKGTKKIDDLKKIKNKIEKVADILEIRKFEKLNEKAVEVVKCIDDIKSDNEASGFLKLLLCDIENRNEECFPKK